MSWSAEAADRAVEKANPELRRIRIETERGDAVVSEVELLGIKRRAVAGLAAKHGLTRHYRWLGARRVAIAATLSIVAAFAAVFLAGGADDLDGALTSPVFLGLAAMAALAAAAVREYGARGASRPEVFAGIVDDVEANRSAAPDRYERLVAALVERVDVPGCLIVDRLEAVDDLTRHVIEAALRSTLPGRGVSGFWILFESAEIGRLAKELVVSGAMGIRHGAMGVTVKLLDQLQLSRDERHRLASALGRPERAGFAAVGDIAGRRRGTGEAATDEALLRFFQGVGERGGDARKALELYYLLAITATAGRNVRFKQRTIERSFAEETAQKGRWAVLRVAMPSSRLTPDDVDAQLVEIDAEFRPVMTATAPGLLRLNREAADTLIAHHEELGLSAPSVCHLFWALHWYASRHHLGGTVWLEKLMAHLLEASLPDELAEADIGLRELVVSACIDGVESALGASLLADVPALLVKGAAFLEGNVESEGGRELRRLAWEAYALLGDERILGVLLELAADTSGVPDDPESPTVLLEQVFADSIALGPESDRSRDGLLERISTLDPAIRGYAQMRAAWLVLTWWRAAPSPEPYWGRLFTTVAPSVLDILRVAVDRLQHRGRDRVPVDVATISIGCWVVVLAALEGALDPDAALDALSEVYLVAVDLPTQQRTLIEEEERYDLPIRGLSQDVVVSVGAAAHLLGRLKPRDDEALRELIREAVGSGPPTARNGVASEIEDRMGLIEYMWRRLGFEQLRSFTTLRRAHFTGLTGSGSAQVEEEIVASLADDRDRPDHAGMIAQAITADVTTSQRTAARHLAYGATLSLQADVAPALSADLCLMAVGASHAYPDIEIAPLVEYLFTAEDASERPPALERFDRMSDEEIARKGLELLNVAKHTADSGVADRLVQLLRARHEVMAPGDDRERLAEDLDLFALERVFRESGAAINSSEQVKLWRERGDGMAYSWVLHLLVNRDPGDITALPAAAAHLGRLADAGPPSTIAPVVLADDLLKALTNDDVQHELESVERKKGINAAVGYLRHWHRPIAPSLTPDRNLKILARLVEYDPRNAAEHIQHMGEWEARRLHDDLVAKLLPLRSVGRWFQILWHYFIRLSRWGLPAHPERLPWEISEHAGTASRPILRAWRQGSAAPAVFVKGPAGPAFSTDFALVGYALFHDESLIGPEWQAQRRAINDASEAGFSAMIELAAKMEHLPDEIKWVLRRHEEALTQTDDVEL
jgi:hypothetical protein